VKLTKIFFTVMLLLHGESNMMASLIYTYHTYMHKKSLEKEKTQVYFFINFFWKRMKKKIVIKPSREVSVNHEFMQEQMKQTVFYFLD